MVCVVCVCVCVYVYIYITVNGVFPNNLSVIISER